MTLAPFHLAFPVHDLAAARAFYAGVLGCPEGRSSDQWIDFDLYGHQIVAHLAVSDPLPHAGEERDLAAVPLSRRGEGLAEEAGRPSPPASRVPPLPRRRERVIQGASNAVDGHDVPVPHFGLVLDMDAWRELAARLEAAGTAFVIAPTVRFEGQPGEQATMFLLDPSGNAIEFKAMRDAGNLFAK